MEGEDVKLRELYWSIPTLQENVDHIRTHLKRAAKTLTGMTKSMEKYTEDSHSLANQLVGFSWNPTGEDKENILVTCGAALTQITRVQTGLNNALHDILISSIDKMLDEMKEDELREAQKQAYGSLVNYNNIHRKLNLAPIERDEKKQKEQEEKRNLEKILIGLTNRLRDLQTVTRFDFTKSLLTWIYANIPAYTQMLEIFSGNKEEFLDVMQGMERSKQEYLGQSRASLISSVSIENMSIPNNESTAEVTKQGYLYQQNNNGVWKPRFVILRQNEFSVYSSWKSKEVKYAANLMLSAVKPLIDPDTPFCFEIITQVKRAQFKAFNQVDYKAWMDILQHGIAEALNHIDLPHVTSPPHGMSSSQLLMDAKLLNHLRSISPANTMCADCGAFDPDYVCINNGAIICTECSTVHRSLSHISKVRSLRTDKINPYIAKLLESMDNDIINQIYLEKEPATKISANTPYKERRLFIQRKYQFRQFAADRISESLEEVSQNLFSALLRGNYPEAVQFMVMGADLSWSNMIDSKKSLCHYVVEDSNVMGLWLLVLNDAPLTLQDAHGNTPLHYAANLALPECVRVLLSVLLQSEVEAKNSNQKTALDVAREHVHRSEEVTEEMREVVKIIEDYLYGAEEDIKLPATPRGGDYDNEAMASPRSSEKKKRSSVMDILKGMKDRRNSNNALKKSDKKTSKSSLKTPEKSPRSSVGGLKFDDSPTIKYFNQNDALPSPARAGTFSYGQSPYKEVDFNDLNAVAAVERESGAVTSVSPRDRSNSAATDGGTTSPRKLVEELIPTAIHEEPDEEVDPKPTEPDRHATVTNATANSGISSGGSTSAKEPKVVEKPVWRPVRTSSTGNKSVMSETVVGNYRNNPYFTYRTSMSEQLAEFEEQERLAKQTDATTRSGSPQKKLSSEAPEGKRRASLTFNLNRDDLNNNNNNNGEEKLVRSPRSGKAQFQNIFSDSVKKNDPEPSIDAFPMSPTSLNINNNNTDNTSPQESAPVAKSNSTPIMASPGLYAEKISSSKGGKDKKDKKEKEKKTPRRSKLLLRTKSKKDKGDKAE